MLTDAEIAEAADQLDVCRRPFIRKVTDRASSEVTAVPIPCGSTRESVCPACAIKARKLRMRQCSEGWHLVDDPLPPEIEPDAVSEDAASESDVADIEAGRRIRSTRRLGGFPELPKVPMEHVSVGRTFTDARTGKTFRPSMFITLTLPSYGPIVPGRGVPAHPSSYDYRRAALDALFFPRLVDRWVQNLRRCAGYKAQYFAAVEPQKRLAPHLHVAIRGAIPRRVIRDVTAATYTALWWPAISQVMFDEERGDRLPEWDSATGVYFDPVDGVVLPSWETALAWPDAEPIAEPFHVLSFGKQLDVKGLVGGSSETEKAVGYLCKYLTKSVAETYTDRDDPDSAYEAHIDRLAEEVRWLPCGEECANWLRYGVTPKDPRPGLVPGACESKAHDREHLGLGGRRVLVSRHWTGKTLSDHAADRGEVVRAVLQEAGIEPPDARRMAADVLASDGLPRFIWEDVPLVERRYAATIALSLKQRQAWRKQYELAKRLLTQAAEQPP